MSGSVESKQRTQRSLTCEFCGAAFQTWEGARWHRLRVHWDDMLKRAHAVSGRKENRPENAHGGQQSTNAPSSGAVSGARLNLARGLNETEPYVEATDEEVADFAAKGGAFDFLNDDEPYPLDHPNGIANLPQLQAVRDSLSPEGAAAIDHIDVPKYMCLQRHDDDCACTGSVIRCLADCYPPDKVPAHLRGGA